MKRAFWIALGSITALLAASLGVISWATGAPTTGHRASPPAAEAVATGTSTLAKASVSPAVPREPQVLAAAVEDVPIAARAPVAPSRSAGGSLESDFVRVRRNFRDEMEHGLASLQEAVADCSAAPASFTLDLESVPGGIRIRSAEIEDRGNANNSSIACAQAKLREHFIDAPSVEPGKRWRISFAVPSPAP